MNRFIGIARCEYRMAIRRWGVWLASALAAAPALVNAFGFSDFGFARGSGQIGVWQFAGLLSYWLNIFLPVVAGIAIADRLVRDDLLGVRELLRAVPFSNSTYLFGKYVGALLAALTPVAAALLVGNLLMLANGAPAVLALESFLAFLAINLPAYAFITAFSLACPMFMPVRVYQVLFTGYWFWGNFLNRRIFPTLNGTLVTPSGIFAFQGFFGGFPTVDTSRPISPQAPQLALLNLGVLALCVVGVGIASNYYLAWQARRA